METRQRRKHLPGRHDQSSHGRRGANLKPRAGRDLTEELFANPAWIGDAQTRNLRNAEGHADQVLSGIVDRQPGWTARGRVVTSSQLDDAVGKGWTEIWRGAKDPHSAVLELTGKPPTGRGRRAIQRDRTGKWEMGHGHFGNGKYFSARKSSAEVYRGSQPKMGFGRGQALRFGPGPLYEFEPGTFEVREPGALLRSAISPDAKIVDYDQLKAEHTAFLASHHADGALGDALNDTSFYAAMRGYDGIRIRGAEGIADGAPYPPGIAGSSEADQFIVFNRSALMFEEASDRYDT